MSESRSGRERASLATLLGANAGALALVATSTSVGLLIAPRWGTAPVDMVYLPAVLAAAALWGLGPGLVAGIGAALAYNFFFTAPVHTFRMDQVTDIVNVVVLFVIALVTSRLAAGVRSQARIAAGHATRNARIAGSARRLLSCITEEDTAQAACKELHGLFKSNVLMVSGLPQPRIVAAWPEGNPLTPTDIAAAVLTMETGKPTGRATPRLQPAEWQFHAVASRTTVLGAIGLARDDGQPAVDDDQLPLLVNLLDQVALALERARLEADARKFAATRERDRMRSALLSSIGQDVRPRLTAIGGAISELRRSGSGDKQLVSAIETETAKLDRYMSNLLNLGPEGDQRPILVAGVTIDLFNRSVVKGGQEIHLTPKEYGVLAELAKHRGRVVEHAHLLRSVWGPAQDLQIEYLRVAVRALRQKLEDDPSQPKLILNEPSVGYRLSPAG